MTNEVDAKKEQKKAKRVFLWTYMVNRGFELEMIDVVKNYDPSR